MDKALEDRLRAAISEAEDYPSFHKLERKTQLILPVLIDLSDAKRLLYRLKKENSKGNELEYRKPRADSKRK